LIGAALANWCQPQSFRWLAAVAYDLSDTAFFMPFYGALILAASRGLGRALRSGEAPFAHGMRLVLQPLMWLLVAALWIIDGLENFGGALRLGLSIWAFAPSLVVAAAVFWLLWSTVRVGEAQSGENTLERFTCRNTLVLVAMVVAVAILVAAQAGTEDAACKAWSLRPNTPYSLAWAHHAKPGFILLALSPITVAWLGWWFGADLDLRGAQQIQGEQRAAWRSGVTGIIGRTRYVLLLILLFAVFTLMLDQCRDVLLSLAGPRPADAKHPDLAMAWSTLVLVLGAVSIAMLAYSSWLWTRLVGMVERPGLALPGGHAVYDRVGAFARGWARAVSLAPLVIVCVLLAHTAGDAARAAQADPAAGGLGRTFAYLLVFGAFAVGGGLIFLQIRRGLPMPLSDYYNSDPDVLELLRDGTLRHRMPTAPRTHAPSDWCHRARMALSPITRILRRSSRKLITPLTRPIVLPLTALVLMLLLRAGMAWDPGTTAQAPATLALLGLALSWWMGIAGAISMSEQRQTIPWGLVLIGIVGAFSLVVDNHVLPLRTFKVPPSDATFATLHLAGFIVTGTLALMGSVWWLAATYSRAPTASELEGHRERARRGGPIDSLKTRVAAALLAFVVALIVLAVIDRWTSKIFGPAAPLSEMHSLDDAVGRWEKMAATASAGDRIYLVASEGGGIRSAYWTARLLAELHEQRDLHFDSRAVVLSGVSGGAIGEAVYRACLRQQEAFANSPTPVVECVTRRFARLDPLSPLIGAFMFEDVFARILPLHLEHGMSICGQPGCGFLSRALSFEREWIRQFPALAEPIGHRLEGEPELMLNSTWVETGNRVVFSSMRLPQSAIPASVEALGRLGAQPSLIAAAHAAARFPFINPLAAIRPEPGASDAGKVIGHLADGGYHENSGAESLADLWHVLRPHLPAGSPVQLILIRNGQTRAGCEKHADKEPPARCVDPVAVTTATDISTAVNRPLLDLYADLSGPAVAVVNVSGIGAHGRQSPASLDADIATSVEQHGIGLLAHARPCLLDQSSEAALVPLGWYLSAAARAAMDAQVQRVVSQPGCFAGVNATPVPPDFLPRR
ncbi:MAG TPA: hypothetical protein VGM74_01170, partial [Burkholderiaceae bacterium]